MSGAAAEFDDGQACGDMMTGLKYATPARQRLLVGFFNSMTEREGVAWRLVPEEREKPDAV